MNWATVVTMLAFTIGEVIAFLVGGAVGYQLGFQRKEKDTRFGLPKDIPLSISQLTCTRCTKLEQQMAEMRVDHTNTMLAATRAAEDSRVFQQGLVKESQTYRDLIRDLKLRLETIRRNPSDSAQTMRLVRLCLRDLGSDSGSEKVM